MDWLDHARPESVIREDLGFNSLLRRSTTTKQSATSENGIKADSTRFESVIRKDSRFKSGAWRTLLSVDSRSGVR